jgi:proliferating cell nuclear antigen
MKCEFKNAKKIHDIFKFVSLFEDHANLDCTEEGISLFTMSNCHTVFIDIKLPAEYFADYKCDEPCKIGLNFTVLLNALGSSKAKDSLMMECPLVGDPVVFTKLGDGVNTQYTIKQMDIENSDALTIPDMKENFTVQLSTAFLKSWKRDIIDFTGAELKIVPTPKILCISSEGDSGVVSLKQQVPSIGIEYLHYDDPDGITLSNKNISKVFGDIGKVSNTIELGNKNDMPFRIGATLDDGGSLRVFVAPCIDGGMDED